MSDIFDIMSEKMEIKDLSSKDKIFSYYEDMFMKYSQQANKSSESGSVSSVEIELVNRYRRICEYVRTNNLGMLVSNNCCPIGIPALMFSGIECESKKLETYDRRGRDKACRECWERLLHE